MPRRDPSGSGRFPARHTLLRPQKGAFLSEAEKEAEGKILVLCEGFAKLGAKCFHSENTCLGLRGRGSSPAGPGPPCGDRAAAQAGRGGTGFHACCAVCFSLLRGLAWALLPSPVLRTRRNTGLSAAHRQNCRAASDGLVLLSYPVPAYAGRLFSRTPERASGRK